jgi:succinoglycan biosynthesis protein ExoO
MPVFNGKDTIGEAIRSALVQTRGDFELVICDDASTDDTQDIVAGFDDNRIRLLHNLTNMGEGKSRDNAIATTSATWITILDADDAWHPRRLESLLEAAGTDKNVMVFDDILVCHHGPEGLVPWHRIRGPRAYGAEGKPVDVSADKWVCSKRLLIKPMIPAEALRGSGITHSSRRFGEDTEFFLNLLSNGLRLRYLPDAYYYYRITPGSMSSLRSRSAEMQEVLGNAMTLFEGNPRMIEALRRRLEAEQRNELYSQFLWLLKDREFMKAGNYAMSRPWIAAEFVGRLLHEMPYQMHRILHHASGRGQT